jgi:hypothetical protein
MPSVDILILGTGVKSAAIGWGSPVPLSATSLSPSTRHIQATAVNFAATRARAADGSATLQESMS